MQNTKPKKRTLDDEVDRVIGALESMTPESDEYKKAVNNLETLLKSKSLNATRLVTPDTIVLAATNLIGILLILNYEQIHVISTRALGFVLRGRS